ncbi:amidase [Pseudonocardia bannensis]|uniref:Amidase n=1 Tax=Pseudonocardia bannensis TaxID=630973 RepID=A0A848DSF5_9PSEU|nr:amidase family protein [Pseudonocardia bannensis]NMH95443.1 amidase [Pseudonocardia bannensis]
MASKVSADPGRLTGLSAVELAGRVRDGRISAVEIARAHLARIAERDRVIGAFQAVDPPRVLAEAAGVDARPDRFALPLAGVPVAIKDNVDVSGFPTRHGSAATSDVPARRDDELVRRLRGAGAVVIGKTRMPELAIWGFTDSALGTTRNPLDEGLDPGGSSGGSAAAVADGMAALALGTDGGGSIRMPAAYCGLVGLKPGAGTVPLPGGADEHWCGLSVAGPIARTAADAAIMFEVLSGRAPAEPSPPARIAMSLRSPSPIARLQPVYRDAVRKAARLLAERGVRMVADDPPYPLALISRWTRRWHAGVALDVAELGLDRRGVERRTAVIARKGRRVLRFGGPRPGVADAWRQRVVSWMDEGGHDLLLLPAVAGPPVAAGALAGRGYLSTLLVSASRIPYTQAWNLAGLPAIVVPVRWGAARVPVQLVGRPDSEALLLATAAALG